MSVSDPVPAMVTEQIELAATPALVFDALVSAEQLGRWWGSSDTYRSRWDVDLRVGGKYRCEPQWSMERR